MYKHSVILSLTLILFGPSIKAHDDVINAATMKDQNRNQAQDSKENIRDKRYHGDA